MVPQDLLGNLYENFSICYFCDMQLVILVLFFMRVQLRQLKQLKMLNYFIIYFCHMLLVISVLPFPQ